MAPASARLEVVAGNATGMSILVENELLMGRHAEGAGRLADDPEISRSHARVTVEDSGFCAVEDLGSTNGTFVNGLRLSGPQTLREGDTIELGATTLVVRELPAVAADQGAEAPSAPQQTVVPGVTPGEPATDPTAEAAASDASAPSDDPATSEAPDPGSVVAAPTPEEPGAEPEAGAFIGLAPALEELTPALEGLAPALEALKPALEGLQQSEGASGSPAGQAEASTAGQLRLQLEVDFDTREAKIFLEGLAEPVRLGFESGSWRITLPPSS